MKKGKNLSKESLSIKGYKDCILYGELFTTYKTIINKVYSKTNLNGYASQLNSILFPSSSTSKNDFFPCSSLNKVNVQIGMDISVFEINKNNDSDFLSYLFSKIKHLRNLYRLTEGTTINHLYQSDISKYKIIISSSLLEQQKIVYFFSLLDKQIQLWERKLELYELKLKFYLNNLIAKFNKPKLRFKEFEGEWDSVKLKDVLNYIQPTKYIINSENYLDDKNLIPVLTAGKSFILGYTNEDFGIFEKESIIFDDFTMDHRYVNFPYKIKSSAIKILTTNNSNLYFINNLLSKKKFIPLGHNRHYLSIVQETNFIIPKIEEQNKIAIFLSSIHQQKKKIEKILFNLKIKKNYYMNNMFI